MSSSPQQQGDVVAQPPVLFNLVGHQLYDEGVLSVKFRVLQGRVVFFRPFVRRRTASMASASRFVDRVVFVVHATGELVVADVDAVPKRSVSLRHVTTILYDSPAATVALLFEASAAEHDVQLVFGDYPSSLLKDNHGGTGNISSSKGSVPAATRANVGGRVSFVDGGTTTTAPPLAAPAHGSSDSGLQQQQQCLPPLMTPKQFVNVVLSFAPNAQVIHGAASSMELKLAKPKHFSEPASVAGSAGAALPSPIALDDAATAPSSQKPNRMFNIVDGAEETEAAQQPSDCTATPLSATLPPKKNFRDVCSTEDGNRKALLDDFSAAATTTGGATPPPAGSSSGGEGTLPKGAGSGGGHEGEDAELPRSLRAIAAAGRYLAPRPHKNRASDQLERPPQQDSPLKQVDDEGVHRALHNLQEAMSSDPADEEGFDPQTAMRRLAMLNRKADARNKQQTHLGDDASATSSQRQRRHAAGGMDDTASAASSPPLLSDMVRKLRARRGEIQMQNLMVNGEVKGLQQRIQAVLHSYQRQNPLPELDAFPVHQPAQRRRQTGGASSDYEGYAGVGNDDGDGVAGGEVKVMTPSKQYNRALNLSLVLLSICRRQRQIHLHAEHDARLSLMTQQQQHRGFNNQSSIMRTDSSATYGGGQFTTPDTLAMMRSHYHASDAFDMEALMGTAAAGR